MLYFIGQVFPYIAAAVFLAGVSWRLITWLRVPVPFQLTLFPVDGGGQFAAVCKEVLVFGSLRRGDKALWLWAYLMHISLAAIIGGHVVGIAYLSEQFSLAGLSVETSKALSAMLGTAAGLTCMTAILVLFYRRTAVPVVKRLSDPQDYFDLLLLLAVVISGLHMRLTTLEIDLAAVRQYMAALLTFRPAVLPDSPIFLSHYFLVNVLLIYLPFSKMIHLAGYFVNRFMVAEGPPVYPTPAGVKRQVWLKGGAADESTVKQS